MTFKWREDPRRGAATQETSEKKPGKKISASTGFKPVSPTLQRRIVKKVKREVFQGVPMSTRTMKERDDELLEVTCDWPLSCLEGLAIFHVASRSGNKTEITHGSYADLYKMCVNTLCWNKKMEKHHNKNKEKMHQRDLLQQTYCGHSLQYILLSWDIIVCLTLWCLPIGIATFRQHTSSLPQLIKETNSVSPNEPFSAMIGWYAVETFRSTSEI